MKPSTVNLHQEMKRNIVLNELLDKGITKTQDGRDIHNVDYETLKYELVLQAFREKDVEADENKWF
ncbi:hypothetical protein ACWE42_14715 [Sutcliffiella cohnii]